MKTNKQIILFTGLLYLFFLFSCSFGKEDIKTEEISLQDSQTKGIDPRDKSFFVTEDDINDIIHYYILAEGERIGAFSKFREFIYDGETTLYFLLFENAEIIISSDKRGPIELSKSYKKKDTLDEANPGVITWLECLSDDIAYRRNCSEEYYQLATEATLSSEQYSLNMWDAINAKVSTPETKDGLPPIIGNGHYELVSVYYTYESYEKIEHLTTVLWHQKDPFNQFCPYKEGSSERCPAGCVAVAGANMLYYLHYKLGVPITSPSNGYCIGDENNYYMWFGDYSSTTWDMMDSLAVYKALLTGDVGIRLNTEYSSDGSEAYTPDLINSVFHPYGIECTLSNSYDKDTVFASLRDGYPVIFAAQRYVSPINWPGHCFLIDGYESYVMVTHFCYEWFSDDSIIIGNSASINSPGYIGPMPYETITLSSPYLTSLYLRWGYNNYYNYDDDPYSTDGIWTYPGRTPYQYLRKMIYDFSIYE